MTKDETLLFRTYDSTLAERGGLLDAPQRLSRPGHRAGGNGATRQRGNARAVPLDLAAHRGVPGRIIGGQERIGELF